MKKVISLVIILSILAGCSPKSTTVSTTANITTSAPELTTTTPTESTTTSSVSSSDFSSQLNDELVNLLDTSSYTIEEIEVRNVSKEYLEEVEAYSKPTIYYGYSLDELNEQFEGKKYIFTLGEDGTTEVKEYNDITEKAEPLVENTSNENEITFVQIKIYVKELASFVYLVCSFIPSTSPLFNHAQTISKLVKYIIDALNTNNISTLINTQMFKDLVKHDMKLLVTTSEKVPA